MKSIFTIALILTLTSSFGQVRMFLGKGSLIPIDTTPVVALPPRCSGCLIINETFATANPVSGPVGFNGFNYPSPPSSGGCCFYSHTISDSLTRFGDSKTLRTELWSTDPDVGTSRRSELNRGSTTEPASPLERWYGISFFFPTGYISDPAPEAITQWHEVSSTASPHFSLWTESGHLYLKYDGGVTQKDLGAYSVNTWYDFVFHINWATTAAGNFNAWMNGVQVETDKLGANMPAGDIHAPYWKFGIYKWFWKKSPGVSNNSHRVLFIDNVRMGGSTAVKADVEPGNY